MNEVKKELAEADRVMHEGDSVVEGDRGVKENNVAEKAVVKKEGGGKENKVEELVTVEYVNCLSIYCYGKLRKFLSKYEVLFVI